MTSIPVKISVARIKIVEEKFELKVTATEIQIYRDTDFCC